MIDNKESTMRGLKKVSHLGFKPSEDGITHINIHPKAKTVLGRELSHFVHAPFIHPYLGRFYSMEGFWYFMRSGQVDDRLRYQTGMRAKQLGKSLVSTWYEEFPQDILAANYQKIIQNDKLFDKVILSYLPFDQYYTFGPAATVVDSNVSTWLVAGLESIRTALKNSEVPQCWVDAERRYAGLNSP